VAVVPTGEDAIDLKLVGNLLYLTAGAGGLVVFDVSNPKSPVQVGSKLLTKDAMGVDVQDKYAYVTARNDGLFALDISDLKNIKKVGQLNLDTGDGWWSVQARGNYVYYADVWRFRIADVSNPSHPALVGEYAPASDNRAVSVVGNYAYVSEYHQGMSALDISDPTDPVYQGTYKSPVGGTVEDLMAVGTTVYIAFGGGGLHIVAATNPTQLVQISYRASLGTATGVHVWDNWVLLADTGASAGAASVRVFDAHNPSFPEEVTAFHTEGVRTMFVDRGWVYVAAGTQGLKVLSVRCQD